MNHVLNVNSLTNFLRLYNFFFKWVLTEVATNAYSMVNVPLYDTLGAEAISFILVQSKLIITRSNV